MRINPINQARNIAAHTLGKIEAGTITPEHIVANLEHILRHLDPENIAEYERGLIAGARDDTDQHHPNSALLERLTGHAKKRTEEPQ